MPGPPDFDGAAVQWVPECARPPALAHLRNSWAVVAHSCQNGDVQRYLYVDSEMSVGEGESFCQSMWEGSIYNVIPALVTSGSLARALRSLVLGTCVDLQRSLLFPSQTKGMGFKLFLLLVPLGGATGRGNLLRYCHFR